jgi:hypothetical protein
MMGIAIRKVSMAGGVSEINDSVNVMEFFTTQILPELQDLVHHEHRPWPRFAINFPVSI